MWWGPLEEGLDAGEIHRVEVHTLLRVPEDGTYRVGASGLGAFTLTLDSTTVLDTQIGLPPGADVVEGIMRPPQRHAPVDLSAGKEISVVLGYRPAETGAAFGGAEVTMLTCALNLAPERDEDAEFDRAVALAAESDVAVVVVGTTEEVESEGFDRADLALPGRQDELVRAVAAVNQRTVVVVNAGAPVLLPWADEVAAVLLAWFPGQEFGNALADVLLGEAEPGGRLPTTWPLSEDGLPSVTPVDGKLTYDEGVFVGYRAYDRDQRTPRFPFGHGLGYTTWEYGGVTAPVSARPSEDVTVTVEIRNSGTREGREVVQVYLSRPDSALERPVRWLAGFATVDLPAGASAQVEVGIPARAFQHWAGEWATEPGVFRVQAGHSSADLPVGADLAIRSD
jgi:beta-glucosidase